MIKLEELRNNYQEIISNDKLHIDAKNKALSSLMSQIERDYNFHLVDAKFTQEQRESEIYKLFFKISNSRDFSDSFYND